MVNLSGAITYLSESGVIKYFGGNVTIWKYRHDSNNEFLKKKALGIIESRVLSKVGKNLNEKNVKEALKYASNDDIATRIGSYLVVERLKTKVNINFYQDEVKKLEEHDSEKDYIERLNLVRTKQEKHLGSIEDLLTTIDQSTLNQANLIECAREYEKLKTF